MFVRGWRHAAVFCICGLTCVGALHARASAAEQGEAGAAPDGSTEPSDTPDDADDPADAEPDPGAKDEAEEAVVSVKSNPEFQVVARSLKLKESSAERLREVAALYRKATGHKLVVTGGDRTAKRQAELMFKKLKSGEDLVKLYARTDLVTAIVDAYKQARAAGASRRGAIARMREVIDEQMTAGDYISRHLNFTAADVRSRGLSAERIKALRDAVKAVAGVSMVDERDGAAPCFHLGL